MARDKVVTVKTGDVIGFNGTTEWALDSIELDHVLWLPREDQLRELMGATDPKKADKGTIRADFADSIDANAVHGSDAAETAAVEIAYYFPALNVYSR